MAPQNEFGYAPARLFQVYRERIGEPVEVIGPLQLDRRGQAQLVVTDARLGRHGLSWEWD